MEDPVGARPAVSVVIPFYNRRAEVPRCLGAVLAQKLSGGRTFEVIAVDNGSTDGTFEALQEFAGVQTVRCLVRGPSAARNAGIGAARAPVVAMIDSDCLAQPGWLEALIEPFADPEMLITGGRIRGSRTENGLALYQERARVLDNEKFFHGGACLAPYFATANCAFQRAALVKTGGFDETFLASEDADLCWRILDLGGRMAYCPEAVVDHAHRETWRGFFHQAYLYGVWSVVLFEKHRARFQVRRHIGWHNIAWMARLLLKTPVKFLAGKTPYERRSAFYDAMWRTAFTLGCLRESLRRQVLFL